jgi:hypothetical protein
MHRGRDRSSSGKIEEGISIKPSGREIDNRNSGSLKSLRKIYILSFDPVYQKTTRPFKIHNAVAGFFALTSQSLIQYS